MCSVMSPTIVWDALNVLYGQILSFMNEYLAPSSNREGGNDPERLWRCEASMSQCFHKKKVPHHTHPHS